ncbi:hypothetical protein [Nocardia noduli]|uniref:hypothetical protein n=1 Tax=Nocardia noduli TaxID=2815722 RepID=UPI001C228968|nr:hypothetical protein [Nocardia noduli]
MGDEPTVRPTGRSPLARAVEAVAQIAAGIVAGGFLYWLALMVVLQVEITLDTDLPFGVDIWLLPIAPPVALGVYLRYSVPRFALASTALIVGGLVIGGGFSALLLS